MKAINSTAAMTGSTASHTVRERSGAPHPDNGGKVGTAQDRVTFSPEELEQSRREAAAKKLQEMESQHERLREQMENANAQADAFKKIAEVEGKCLTIAMRIISGDTVPQQDYRYLAKNNSELYARAITLRVERSDPRKHKPVSEEEKEEKEEKAEGIAIEAAQAPAQETGSAEAEPPSESAAPESAPATLDVRA